MEMSGQLHDMATLPLGKQPRYPLVRRLGGPQSWTGCSSKEIRSLSLLGIESVFQPIG
jgi:hypothetical protein